MIGEDGTPPTVRELGEFALIERINAGRRQGPQVLLGPGDDAAVVAAPDGRFAVSTDMLVEGRHFRLDWSTPHDVGRKAIAQNAADVFAMGARPTAFVVALGCPADTPVEVIDGLAAGMWAEAERVSASVAGGDLVRSREVVVSITAFGDLGGLPPITRAGARPGHVVAVAGRLGWSAAGLAVLTTGAAPDGPGAEAVALHRVPHPPYEAAPVGDGPRPHALTDVSDGLLADLGHIADASGVAIDLSASALRDDALTALAATMNVDARQWVLGGGEDHAFVGAWAREAPLPPGWRAIGTVRAGSGVTVDGMSWDGAVGWESFRGAEAAPGNEPR
ncbi:thiamine-phosphate kinase [Nocardia farcinica]|uniref:thiamine-phosphate kinase n=1 Tax=Nocardia farcinica TaxID=37329 RepID=UPI002B4B8DE7|nr:thiamine-phosphate kinase [Nocardia farcinica]